jgi:hypothetical protein
MRRLIAVVVLAVVLVVGLIVAYRQMNKEMEMEGEMPVFAPSRVSRNAAGEIVLKVDLETQKRINLQVLPVSTINVPRVRLGYGRVLDPAPLATMAADVATAQTALNASAREFARVKALHEQGDNASLRALEAAQAAMQRDEISLRSAENLLQSAWGKAVAQQQDLLAFVRSLTSQEAALVRADLPAGEIVQEGPKSARIAMEGDGESIAAAVLGPAPQANPEIQGQAFLLLVKARPPRLSTGLMVSVLFEEPGEQLHGIVLAREAVSRAAGAAWTYVQLAEEAFVRRQVALDRLLSNGWFVTSGLATNDRVVVRGAQTLLSEELKTQVPALAE